MVEFIHLFIHGDGDGLKSIASYCATIGVTNIHFPVIWMFKFEVQGGDSGPNDDA